ncbi:MAG TPA: NADP-dependent oxidoreductase, partial [Parvularcula sp.]|nr:NADP-dependent oxidoreductase [Parvularcula sp.]
MTKKAKAIYLKAYPQGLPRPDDFVLRTVDVGPVGDGEALLRTVWMSVDPYMRGRMRADIKSYIPPFSLSEPLDGGAVSEVVESRHPGFQKGDYVVAFQGGWKEYSVAGGAGLQKVDPRLAP